LKELLAARAAAIQAQRSAPQFGLPPAPGYPGSRGVAPGLGKGLLRVTLPGNYGNYGVVTIWNNTPYQVLFGVSASTYNNGQPYPFLLNPGQGRSFFAPVVYGMSPVFQVRFGTNPLPVTLPQTNTVFEGPGWSPVGTAGYPYAINIGVNGYFISSI